MKDKQSETLSKDVLDRVAAALNHAFEDHQGVPRAYILVAPSETTTQWTTNLDPKIAQEVLQGLATQAQQVAEENKDRPFVKVYPPEKDEKGGAMVTNMGQDDALTAMVDLMESEGVMIVDEAGKEAVKKVKDQYLSQIRERDLMVQVTKRKIDEALKVINDLSGQLVDTYQLIRELLDIATSGASPKLRAQIRAQIRTQMEELEKNLDGARAIRACYNGGKWAIH